MGDGWHPIGGVPTIPLEPEDVKSDLATVGEYAVKAGRDPKTIHVALKGSLFDKEKKIADRRRRFMGSAEEIAGDIREYGARRRQHDDLRRAPAELGGDLGADGVDGEGGVSESMKQTDLPNGEFADLPGVRLWYTDSGGSGVPLMLLHANTGNADSWQYNIPGFVEAGIG